MPCPLLRRDSDEILLLSLQTKGVICKLKGHTHFARAAEFDPAGKFLARSPPALRFPGSHRRCALGRSLASCHVP